jgi:hypothetical protein
VDFNENSMSADEPKKQLEVKDPSESTDAIDDAKPKGPLMYICEVQGSDAEGTSILQQRHGL